MPANQTPTATIGRWFLLWTTIGCVFALQLRWYHELPWSLSIFWGLADWYLWGLLALLSGTAIRRLKHAGISISVRLVLYLFFAPAVVALHVIFTMLVGGIGGLQLDTQWVDYFQALYAKKLTLNLLTCAAIVLIFERLSDDTPRKEKLFLTKLGDVSRLISADEIIWGEVCGNYVNLHTGDGVWPLRDTLSGLLDRLPRGKFVRISRSAMVSLRRVHEQCLDGRSLTLSLEGGTRVRVSRRYRPHVRQALRDHCLCDPLT
jgi:DNA-binding LytR/AlgR family response regulator